MKPSLRAFLARAARRFAESFATGCVLLSLSVTARGNDSGSLQPGLEALFTHGETAPPDATLLPNLRLYVADGHSPTPFLPAGRFTTVWRGLLRIDLRGDYAFQAELRGDLKLELNGRVLLDAHGDGATTPPSEFTRLTKGDNTLVATYRSPASGDAWLRLRWIPKGALPSPIPSSAFFHPRSNAEIAGGRLRDGRELFMEHLCARCHTPPVSGSGPTEPAMDAPDFEDIGARLNAEWMAEWILDPKSKRGIARMPRMLHGGGAAKEAADIAAFLASLKDAAPRTVEKPAADPESGGRLFESLHCAACHTAPRAADRDPEKLSLAHLDAKFAPGALRRFLEKPEAHHARTRMPNFKLSDSEAAGLAAYLTVDGTARAPTLATDAASIGRGRQLVQTRGCLNCHRAGLENHFTAPPLAALLPPRWNNGCLSEQPDERGAAPVFVFSTGERGALAAFGATDRKSLARDVAAESALRQMKSLRCAGCHGQIEGIPPLEILGGKLKPEWSRQFIAGDIPYKPRLWLAARMPGFPAYARLLAEGMASLHGLPPRTEAESPPDPEAAKVGRKLVSMEGGFACVACHAIGSTQASQAAESPGINLAHSGSRLLKPYFERWVRNPQSIDPSTKMPVYFDDEGRSPLADYFGGDAAKQIDAIWQHLRPDEPMPTPQTAPAR
jgi:mono/diheme cytochrome c family protein